MMKDEKMLTRLAHLLIGLGVCAAAINLLIVLA